MHLPCSRINDLLVDNSMLPCKSYQILFPHFVCMWPSPFVFDEETKIPIGYEYSSFIYLFFLTFCKYYEAIHGKKRLDGGNSKVSVFGVLFLALRCTKNWLVFLNDRALELM